MNIFQPNPVYIKQSEDALRARAAKRAQGDFRWLTLKDLGAGAVVYFYLLPPWSQRGALYRQVFKHFNMLGDVTVAICWKTYDVLHPGMGDQCPICSALKAVQRTADEKAIDKMWTKGRANINALILGKRLLDHNGHPVDPFIPLANFEKGGEEPKKPRIFELSLTTCDELMTAQGPMGFICTPESAVVCNLKKSGTGLDTEYKLGFSGSDDPMGGFRPMRTPMFQTPEDATACLGTLEAPGLPDLDKIWALPDTEMVNNAHKLGQAIRMHYGMPDQAVYPSHYMAPVASSPGAQAAFLPPPAPFPGSPGYTPPGVPPAPPQGSFSSQYPMGTTPFDGPVTPPPAAGPVITPPAAPPAAPPVAPPVAYQPPISQPPAYQPPALPVAAPPPAAPPPYQPPVAAVPPGVPPASSPGGVPNGVPPAAPPAPAAPPPPSAVLPPPPPPTTPGGVVPPPPPQNQVVGPAILGLTLERLRTEAFGPLPPSDGTPLNRPACFRQMGYVKGGPNDAWCDHCPFRQICKTVSPAAPRAA